MSTLHIIHRYNHFMTIIFLFFFYGRHYFYRSDGSLIEKILERDIRSEEKLPNLRSYKI